MDYKEKYNKLVNAIKVLQETNPSDEGIQNWVKDNIPELAESEGEKTREAIISFLKSPFVNENITDEKVAPWLAWLEKQGTSYTKRDVDDAYAEGMAFAKNELEKQKPAWSVEDTFKVQRICKYLDEAKKYYADITEVRECIDWLKSLKQRYTWKPSDEQMHMLRRMITALPPGEVHNGLESLYNDLETLKGE